MTALALRGALLLALAGPPPAEPELVRRLSSPSLDVRRAAVRELDPERIAQLEPAVAVRAAVVAAADADARIRQTALGGLALLTALTVDRATASSASGVADAIRASRELRPTLERALRHDPDVDVAVAAAMPFMMVFGADAAAEAAVLDRVGELASPADQVRLLGSVAIGGIDAQPTLERLGRLLDDGAPIVQHKAALLLLSGRTLPKDRLDDFLRILETPETFADPYLVRALPRFGVAPDVYLPRLLALQSRLEEELQKPAAERTLAIYNDDYWRQAVQEAVAAARDRTP